MGAILINWLSWLITPLALFAGAYLLYFSWCSFLYWTKKRELFHLLLTFLLLVAAPLVSLTVYRNSWGVALGAIIIVAGELSFRVMLRKQKELHSAFLKGGILTLAVCLSLGTLSVFQQYTNYQQRTDERLKKAIDVVSSREQQARELAFKLSGEAFVTTLVEGGSQNAAITEAQRFLVSNQLQFITITSLRGKVLLRAHDQTRSGDSILDFSPWVLPALSGEVVSGKAYDERGLPTVSAAFPVKKDTVPIGAIVLGFNLNQNFASDIRNLGPGGIAIGTVQGIRSHSTGSSIETSLYSSAALNDIVRKELTQVIQGRKVDSFTARLILDEESHLIQARVLSTLVSSQPIALMTVEVDTQLPVNPYALTIIVTILVLILFNLKTLITLTLQLPSVSLRRKRD